MSMKEENNGWEDYDGKSPPPGAVWFSGISKDMKPFVGILLSGYDEKEDGSRTTTQVVLMLEDEDWEYVSTDFYITHYKKISPPGSVGYGEKVFSTVVSLVTPETKRFLH